MVSERSIALILGGSSGLGLAIAHKLAIEGYDLLIVHRDSRSEQQRIQSEWEIMRNHGAQVHAYNADATRAAKRSEILDQMLEVLEGKYISVLVHSIAKGNLKPMTGTDRLQEDDFIQTITSMGTSLVGWANALLKRDLFAASARIIALTSEGSRKPMHNYAAVSAAKASLEAIIRSMALEYAPLGITANCIQAGVTATASMQRIPDSHTIMEHARQRNPHGRLTTPQDVAGVAYLLTRPEAAWTTGSTILADGGESLQ